MSDEENQSVPMAECGACRAVIPLDSSQCPQCNTVFSGVSEEALGECGACNQLVPLDSTRCPECGVVFVADDVVDILRAWVNNNGINIRKLFDRFDENSDGTIDASELKKGLLSLNLADLPPSQVDRLVAEIDADGNGVIDLDEFDAILVGEDSTQPKKSETSSTQTKAKESTTAVESLKPSKEVEDTVKEEQEEEFDAEQEDHSEDVDASDEELEESTDEFEEEEDAEESSDDETDSVEEADYIHPLQILADFMDEHDISAQRMFNDLDKDGNGRISLSELTAAINDKYGDILDEESIARIMNDVDTDGDGMIDVTEFIDSLETLDEQNEEAEEEKPPKIFPTPWQKRMMSKTWNDSVWPILHVLFGMMIIGILVNGFIGPVDGTGGTVIYEPNEFAPPLSWGLKKGDPFPCDEEYQLGGCSNSLTPLAGENGSISMPKGFYWDAYLFLFLSLIGIGASLFLHLVKAKEWRARMRAMKEVASDKADAAESAEEEEAESSAEDDADDAETIGDEENTDSSSDVVGTDEDESEAEDEKEASGDDDAIDIGSHIGLMLEDEEVFGVILEFDDDEGTVTIEEDGTGDLITGYQEDMFVE